LCHVNNLIKDLHIYMGISHGISGEMFSLEQLKNHSHCITFWTHMSMFQGFLK
jgi:hypothetical protein